MSIKFANLLKVTTCQCSRRAMSVQLLKEIFLKSVEAVKPETLIRQRVRVTDRHLWIDDRSYPLRKPCYVAGFGKAVLGMALTLEELLQDRLEMGVVTVPAGILQSGVESRIKFVEGAKNNVPDEEALAGAAQIRALVEPLTSDDLLVVLISGGGSALLPLPVSPITLQEKQDLIKQLFACGADIVEVNRVRKQMSLLKGGGLAELAHPAQVVALVLSDVVGDPLDAIASGPTCPNPDRPEDALEVIEKYGLRVPPSVEAVLARKRPPGAVADGGYEHVDNFLIGNNRVAAEAARLHALSSGLQAAVISTSISGDLGRISRIYAELARDVADVSSGKRAVEELRGRWSELPGLAEALINLDLSRDVCFIAAGEPTVVVTGSGRGGRNQQLALELSVRLNKLNVESADISFLSCGTDGMDGPTDAAGAIGTSDLVNNSLGQNIKVEDYLNNNDAYSFYSAFEDGRYLIKTGHTGTNVMDIHVMIVKPKRV